MDRNDIRAVVHAYRDLWESLRRQGITYIDTEDLVKAVEDLVNQYPETYYRGPDLG